MDQPLVHIITWALLTSFVYALYFSDKKLQCDNEWWVPACSGAMLFGLLEVLYNVVAIIKL